MEMEKVIISQKKLIRTYFPFYYASVKIVLCSYSSKSGLFATIVIIVVLNLFDFAVSCNVFCSTSCILLVS